LCEATKFVWECAVSCVAQDIARRSSTALYKQVKIADNGSFQNTEMHSLTKSLDAHIASDRLDSKDYSGLDRLLTVYNYKPLSAT
jgi:hypothetical protein